MEPLKPNQRFMTATELAAWRAHQNELAAAGKTPMDFSRVEPVVQRNADGQEWVVYRWRGVA